MIEPLPEAAGGSKPLTTHHYPEAVLFEDSLTPGECSEFIEDIQAGKIILGEIAIERQGTANWQTERVPLKNEFMSRAGLCVTTRFESRSRAITQGPLIAPHEPYYPEIYEAARHWLPFSIYHGQSDARNQTITLLLPETRAFFTDAKLRDGMLELTIGGSDFEHMPLTVSGAWWAGNALQHFQSHFIGGNARVPITEQPDRLEYVLLGSNGALHDFQREDRFGDSGLGTRRLDSAAQNLSQQVLNASRDGEGMYTEFKPFISANDYMGPKGKKAKFREVVTTAVAFANTRGGRIYLGIDDECTLSGVSNDLRAWAKAELDEDVTRHYCGALTSRLKDELLGDVPLRVSDVTVNGALIIVVEILPSPTKPVRVRDDNLFYVRAGASNKQLPPEEWESFLGTPSQAGVPRLDIG